MNSGLTVEYFCEMEDCLASVIIPILDKPSEYGWVENHIWPSPWVICPKHSKTFQLRVHECVMDCFGKESAFFVRETFYRACYYLGGEFETVKFVEARSIKQAVELAQKRTPWGSCYYVDICTRVEDPETGEITCQTRRLSPHELFRARFAIL